jgi:hypothetical protein
MTKSRKKAYSMVEILVALVVVSGTMITSMSLFTSSLLSVKKNEVRNFSDGLAIKAFELLKSPKDIALPSTITTSPSYFRLTENNTLDARSYEDLANCSKFSGYYYVYTKGPNDIQEYVVCLQIIIKKDLVQPFYYITINTRPENSSDTTTLNTIRYDQIVKSQ